MARISLVIILIATCALACSLAPRVEKRSAIERIPDGVYEGSYSSFPNFAKVRVTIASRRITKVELVRHVASERGKNAAVVIPSRIVEQQSTEVDAVTGATNSSRVIMHATEEAIRSGKL